jgi:hypothetical protein
MLYTELRHGDILLFTHKEKATFLQKLIRLIEGSSFIHSAAVREVDGKLYILEALTLRTLSYAPFYYLEDAEEVFCFRPTFNLPEINEKSFWRHEPYGYLCLADSALNHFLHRLTFGCWTFKPIFQQLFRYRAMDCSVLVANMLEVSANTSWCKYNDVVEPDDYALHPSDFVPMGQVMW